MLSTDIFISCLSFIYQVSFWKHIIDKTAICWRLSQTVSLYPWNVKEKKIILKVYFYQSYCSYTTNILKIINQIYLINRLFYCRKNSSNFSTLLLCLVGFTSFNLLIFCIFHWTDGKFKYAWYSVYSDRFSPASEAIKNSLSCMFKFELMKSINLFRVFS